MHECQQRVTGRRINNTTATNHEHSNTMETIGPTATSLHGESMFNHCQAPPRQRYLDLTGYAEAAELGYNMAICISVGDVQSVVTV